MRILLAASVLCLALVRDATGFTSPISHCSNYLMVRSNKKSMQPLFYRQLDDQDNDSNLLKARSRAPPGFNLKRQLSNQQLRVQRKPKSKRESGMNVRLIVALFINQFLILGLATAASVVALLVFRGPDALGDLNQVLHWEESVASQTKSVFNLLPTADRVGKGLVGVVPMLAVANAIERSDKRVFHNINFSTISMCMTLFGRRTSPPKEFLPQSFQGRTFPTTSWKSALGVSALLSAVTGLCEEGVFRRLVPSVGKWIIGPAVAPLLGIQAVLFAFGHVKPQSINKPESQVLLGLQIFNGLTLGSIYLASGGDIVPCIVAHTVYDTVEFFKTWFDANKQLEYAETEYEKELPAGIRDRVRSLFDANGVRFDSKKYKALKRLFYTFDYNKNLTLSLSEVRKGLSYLAVERAGAPPPTKVIDRLFYEVDSDGDKRLDFSEFVDLYFRSMKRKQEVKAP